MRKSIYRFKYNGKKEYSEYYARAIASRLNDKIISYNAQAFIPVPMYKKKEKKRGYNQAYLIAKELSNLYNIPLKNNIIKREKSTKIMRSLGSREREDNLKKAFKICVDGVELNNVIIVDDIYTTGSTVEAVSKVLKDAGVKNVYVVALSTGRIDN